MDNPSKIPGNFPSVFSSGRPKNEQPFRAAPPLPSSHTGRQSPSRNARRQSAVESDDETTAAPPGKIPRKKSSARPRRYRAIYSDNKAPSRGGQPVRQKKIGDPMKLRRNFQANA